VDDQGRLFEIAIDKMKQGLCFFDSDQRLIACNSRYAEIYGLSFAETSPGTTLAKIAERAPRSRDLPRDDGRRVPAVARPRRHGRAGSRQHVRLCDGRTIAIHHEPMPAGAGSPPTTTSRRASKRTSA
jgi:PAS domain-containing protein